MSARVSAVQAYLVADAQDHPLPSPQPIDLATDVIPYGARVRLEVDVEASGPVHPLLAEVTGPEVVSWVYIFPTDGGMTFSTEVRIPADFVYGETDGASASFRFPIPDWQPTGHLPPLGGECLLRICPIPVGTKPTWPLEALPPSDGPLPTFETSFRVGAPPPPGGAAPRIVAVEGGPTDGRVRVGEPWLATAQVEDADDDVAGVLFCVVRGGRAKWSRCDPDASAGPGEVRYSVLRLGGDGSDWGGLWGDAEDPIVFFFQAVDLRGNWSEPAVMNYTLRRDLPPLWMDESAADGPNIIAAGANREQGLFDHPRVWAQCDRGDVWVCARILTYPEQVCSLWGNPQAAGGAFRTVPLPRPRYLDVVFYAVPKTGPKTIGAKMAATCPPVA